MIELYDVTKTFGKGKNAITALRGVTLQGRSGEILGLVGANGAGKTTLMRLIATTLSPSSGKITVLGKDATKSSAEIRQSVGILFGGDAGLYDRLTVRENVEYFARLAGKSKEEAHTRTEELARIFAMEGYLDRPAGKLSKGMKQKTCFARAIVHNPPVMLLDEPTSGLDALAAEEVWEFMRLCRKQGKTVVFSTHNMGEVEDLCDRVAVVRRGEIVACDTPQALISAYGVKNFKQVFYQLVGVEDENA